MLLSYLFPSLLPFLLCFFGLVCWFLLGVFVPFICWFAGFSGLVLFQFFLGFRLFGVGWAVSILLSRCWLWLIV
jgi:hypothetical protein